MTSSWALGRSAGAGAPNVLVTSMAACARRVRTSDVGRDAASSDGDADVWCGRRQERRRRSGGLLRRVNRASREEVPVSRVLRSALCT